MYILYVFARQNTTGIASSRGRVSSQLGLAIKAKPSVVIRPWGFR